MTTTGTARVGSASCARRNSSPPSRGILSPAEPGTACLTPDDARLAAHKRLQPVFGADHLKALDGEQLHQHAPHQRVVIDDQNVAERGGHAA